MFITLILAIGLAVLIFVWARRATAAVYELGKLSLSSRDPYDFMELPYSALQSSADKAIFHFMIQRPWRDTENWFCSFIIAKQKAESGHSNPEVLKYALAMYEAMIGPAPLELVLKLRGLPPEIRRIAPVAYSEWGIKHKRMLRAPHLRVGDFVAESSKAAASACVGR